MFVLGLVGLLLASTLGIEAQSTGIVRGVNLGGWLVAEPWMTPSLFNATATIDEWSLCTVLGKQKCLQTLQNHWSTFYTRDDFVQIKNAGLRYGSAVRIPIGHWAVDLADFEPYVSGQYPYLIQAVQWAGQLGLKVFIDIHGAPGSQNGWEETGHVGTIGFPLNSSNADRTLNVVRNLTKEFSQSLYGGVVTNIEPLNEPTLSIEQLHNFYKPASNIIGANNATSGINVTISDGFFNPHSWANFDPNNPGASAPASRLTVDTHQFWAFPPFTSLSKPEILQAICDFAKQIKNSSTVGIPPTLVGEWSLSTGITANSTTDAGQDQAKRSWFRQLFEAQNAAFTPNAPGQASIGWYFWAWKTEYDIDAWSYRKGLADQYIPSNISNASTLAFPILANGCIDPTFNYTAPALPSSTGSSTSASSTPTSSATLTASADPGASPSAKSTASGMFAGRWLQACVAVGLAAVISIL